MTWFQMLFDPIGTNELTKEVCVRETECVNMCQMKKEREFVSKKERESVKEREREQALAYE